MKNLVIILGFILSAIAGFALMNISSNIPMASGAWAVGGEKLMAVEQSAQPMIDKCRLDRLQGRLKNHEESVSCSNPAVREAFIKHGFANTEQLDEYLKLRKDYARMLDNGEIAEDRKLQLSEDAMQKLLRFAPKEEAKK